MSRAHAKAPRSLKARALQLLAQREQSRLELRRKLLAFAAEAARSTASLADERSASGDEEAGADREPPVAEVDALLDWLEANRFLSAERFAESRVHARSARFGNRRIQQELQQHQVPLSPEAKQRLKDSEFERARAVWLRKFPVLASGTTEQAKQARFLIGRGFSPDVVRRLLRDDSVGD